MAILDLIPGFDDIPGLGSILGTGDEHLPSLAQNIPARNLSFRRKWEPALPLVARRYSKQVWGPVMQIDAERVAQGQNPLSARETIIALNAAQTRQRQTPGHSENIIERIGTDIRELVTGIPQLPSQIIKEIPQVPEGVQGALADVAKGDFDEALAQPGIRFIPGTYVAGSLLRGENPFMEHPIYSLLDVLPYASKAAAAAPRVAAESARLAELGEIRKAAPLRTFLREYAVKPGGELVEAKTGFRLKNWLNTAGLGSDVADVSQLFARYGRKYTGDYEKELASLRAVAKPYDDIAPERRVELSRYAADPTFDRSVLGTHERGYADDIGAWMDEHLTEPNIAAGELIRIDNASSLGLGRFVEGEIYTRRSRKASRLASLARREPKLENVYETVADQRARNAAELDAVQRATAPYMAAAFRDIPPPR